MEGGVRFLQQESQVSATQCFPQGPLAKKSLGSSPFDGFGPECCSLEFRAVVLIGESLAASRPGLAYKDSAGSWQELDSLSLFLGALPGPEAQKPGAAFLLLIACFSLALHAVLQSQPPFNTPISAVPLSGTKTRRHFRAVFFQVNGKNK